MTPERIIIVLLAVAFIGMYALAMHLDNKLAAERKKVQAMLPTIAECCRLATAYTELNKKRGEIAGKQKRSVVQAYEAEFYNQSVKVVTAYRKAEKGVRK